MLKRSLVVAFVAASRAVWAQPSAEEIINKYYEACGGKAKLQAVKTEVQKGKLTLTDMGMEAAYSSHISPPNSVNVSDFTGMGIVKNGISDGYSWTINPFQGNSVNKSDARATLFPLLYLDVAQVTLKVEGEETVGDVACYKVASSGPGGNNSTLYFAKDTGLLVQTVRAGDSGVQTTALGDYKDVNGVKVPHSIAQTGGEFNMTITLDSVEHNVDIPAETLAIPADLASLKEAAK